MFGYGQLTRSQARKADLLRQSTAHRLALVEEAQNLRPVVVWVDLGIGVARKVGAAWSAVAPLLSLWKARKEEGSGFLGKLTGAVSLFRSLTELWKSWR